jgi:hypothetical protein
MYEVNLHIKRVNTAAYLVIAWSVFMTFMSLLIFEKTNGVVSSSNLVLGILEMVVLFVSAVGVSSKRYSLLWLILIVLLIDTIGMLVIGISGPLAIAFRLVVIVFVIIGIRSATLLKDISNFYQKKTSEPITDHKPESNYFDYKQKETTIHRERYRSDFNTDEEYYSYLLNISLHATVQEIKIGYKKAMKENHPDRFEHLGEEFRNIAEARTKLINEAMEYFRNKYNFN